MQHDFAPELKEKLSKMFKKDKRRYEIIMKKIGQVCSSDEFTIEHYKNLKAPKQYLKRVHIDKSFVLTFYYDKTREFILFTDFDHHDNVY